MGALLALIPVRDWFYGGLAAAALIAGLYYHHKYEAAVVYAAAVKTESAKVQAAAAAQVAELDSEHTATVNAIQEKQLENLKAAAAQSASLASRLRQYEAHRCPVTVLESPGAPDAGGAASAGSVEAAIDGVVSAAAHDNAVIQSERAERDSLTGK